MLTGLEESLIHLIQNWYLATGYLGIVLAMTLESCGIPLPSEIVMPLAGYFVFAHPDQFSLVGVALAGAVGCVIGSAIAYWIGATGGRPLILKYGRYILISKADADRADKWFEKYGNPVAFFSRLLPVIRTYISFPAGISRMNFWTFILFTFLGSLIWSFALAWVGFCSARRSAPIRPSCQANSAASSMAWMSSFSCCWRQASATTSTAMSSTDREARAAGRVED